jgi:hypothetical protein
MLFHDNSDSIGLHCVLHCEFSFVNFMLYTDKCIFLGFDSICLGLGLEGQCLGLEG